MVATLIWKAMDFEEKQAYIQYAMLIIQSILRKANFQPDAGYIQPERSRKLEIIKLLPDFGRVVKRAALITARRLWLPDTASVWLKPLTNTMRILFWTVEALKWRDSRLALSYSTAVVLKSSAFAGVESPGKVNKADFESKNGTPLVSFFNVIELLNNCNLLNASQHATFHQPKPNPKRSEYLAKGQTILVVKVAIALPMTPKHLLAFWLHRQ